MFARIAIVLFVVVAIVLLVPLALSAVKKGKVKYEEMDGEEGLKRKETKHNENEDR